MALNQADYRECDAAGNLVLEERIRNRDRSWTNIMTLGLIDRPDVPPPITIVYPDNAERPATGSATASEAAVKEEKKGSIFGLRPCIDVSISYLQRSRNLAQAPLTDAGLGFTLIQSNHRIWPCAHKPKDLLC